MARLPVVSTQVSPATVADIDILARRFRVSRSEVVRAFIEAGLEQNPISEAERAEARAEAEAAVQSYQRKPGSAVLTANNFAPKSAGRTPGRLVRRGRDSNQ